MEITKEVILKDYQKLKRLVDKSVKQGKWENACCFVKMAANLMYNSNLIYADDELESFLKTISEKILEAPDVKKSEGGTKKKLVFYDYFMLDNRGLTEQYLEALFDSDYEVLFVGFPNGEKSKEIIRKLDEHKDEHKIKTFFIYEKKETVKAKAVFNAINDFKPAIIFAHTSPWDIAGLAAISRFENCCARFLTNITDHAFWLGAKVFDYFIEFRNYGYNISKKYRGIPEEKLLILPYYPIVNKNIPFSGFNFDTTNKKLIFSGGSIYKIQGSPIFLEIVKYILDKHEDAIFLFLGNGDFSYLQKFVDKNNYQGRFFFSKERKDIYEVFKHCTLYLNTYPMIGGLMTQYACVSGKLPITLNTYGANHCNNIHELLLGKNDIKIQFSTKEDCEKAIDYYLENHIELTANSEIIKSEIITPNDFRNYLFGFFNGKIASPINKINYDINIKEWADNYIKRFNENKCISYYKLFICKSLKIRIIFIKYFVFYYFFTKFKKIITIFYKKLHCCPINSPNSQIK